MRSTTAEFAAAIGVSHKVATTITCTVPGGSPVSLSWDAGTVNFGGGVGIRRTATLNVTPTPGVDTYSIVSTPGAVFDIDHGVDFGAGVKELVDVFQGEAADGGVNIVDGNINLSLSDMWQRVERCRFAAPYSPAAGTRSSRITAAIVAAVPTTSTSELVTGGSTTGGQTWERDRTQFVKDLATDGGLDVGFDGAGLFVVRNEPILDPTRSVWTFRTGGTSNILTAERKRPLDRLYNTVVILPADESQTWARQTVGLSDTTHPRHPSKIGTVPYFFSSPTITTAAQALTAGRAILQRVLGTTETVSLGALSHPGLEYGDTVSIIHEATDSDPGFAAIHLIESGALDLKAGAMTVQTRSSSLAAVEENA